MTIDLPANARTLLAEIARDSLARSFREALGIDPPAYIIENQHEIKRAAREWSEHCVTQIAMLGRVAQQALCDLDQSGLEAAIEGFTSSIITQPNLDSFMRANPYLEELVADTCSNADKFRSLLKLLINLPSTNVTPPR